MNSTSSSNHKCTHCGKEVVGGTYIQGVFYCPMCASLINANNRKSTPAPLIEPTNPFKVNPWAFVPDCCIGCSNHPSNGGSGICHCTLPYLNGQGPTCSTNTSTKAPTSVDLNGLNGMYVAGIKLGDTFILFQEDDDE